MKTTKLASVVLKFIRVNSFGFILLLLMNCFMGCSASKSVYPKDWAPIAQNSPLDSYAGTYTVLLLKILESNSYNHDDLNSCKVDFWIENDLELKFRLLCKEDINSKSNPSFNLITPYRKVVTNGENGILIHYKDFKADAWGFESITKNVLVSKAKDGSLLIEKSTFTYGAILWIIPAEWKKEHVWYRLKDNIVERSDNKQ